MYSVIGIYHRYTGQLCCTVIQIFPSSTKERARPLFDGRRGVGPEVDGPSTGAHAPPPPPPPPYIGGTIQFF